MKFRSFGEPVITMMVRAYLATSKIKVNWREEAQ